MLTQHNDNGRTGVNSAETALSTANVTPERFGRLWTLHVDGQVVAQALYVSQLRIDTGACTEYTAGARHVQRGRRRYHAQHGVCVRRR